MLLYNGQLVISRRASLSFFSILISLTPAQMSTENHHFNAEIFHAAANTGQKDSENDVVAEHLDNVPAKDEYCGADHGADSQLHRTLSTRHVTMVALGSAIGMGMWLGSGTSLQNGGPVSLVLAFVVASTVLWGMTQSLGEMAVMYPLPSAYVRWVTMFVSPAAGFAVGWGYWCSDWITVANELQVRIVYIINRSGLLAER